MPQTTQGDTPEVPPTGSLQLLRDPKFRLLTRALLLEEVTRLKLNISPRYWTYPCDGDEVLAADEDIALVAKVLSKAVGCTVSFSPAVLPKHSGQEVLRMRQPARVAVLREVLALLANLSSDDLAGLPPIPA